MVNDTIGKHLTKASLVRVGVLVTVWLVIMAACFGRAQAKCSDMASETAVLANQLKNMAAARDAGLSVMPYYNAARLQFEKLKLEHCENVHYVAHAMAVIAMMEASLGGMDYATAIQFAHAKAIDCAAFALVFFEYRIATAWTELHFAYNHGYQEEDFGLARTLESDYASTAHIALPVYSSSMDEARLFMAKYDAMRRHAISITPGLCGMQMEVEDTAP